jgi:hypothetical protein
MARYPRTNTFLCCHRSCQWTKPLITGARQTTSAGKQCHTPLGLGLLLTNYGESRHFVCYHILHSFSLYLQKYSIAVLGKYHRYPHAAAFNLVPFAKTLHRFPADMKSPICKQKSCKRFFVYKKNVYKFQVSRQSNVPSNPILGHYISLDSFAKKIMEASQAADKDP